MKKIIVLVYSNLYTYLLNLLENYSDCFDIIKYQDSIRLITQRDLKKYSIKLSEQLNQNNKKILKYIEIQIGCLESNLAFPLRKIVEFIHDFDLEEGFKYLLEIFNKAYSQKGVISE